MLNTPVIQAPPGGIMTREVGAITGDVQVSFYEAGPGRTGALVTYMGGEEWYHVMGSTRLGEAGMLELLATDPGRDGDGNPLPVRLG